MLQVFDLGLRMFKRISLLLVSAALAALAPIANPTLAAQSSKLAPAELENVVSALDKAASAQDLETVMKYYAPSFNHADGLDRDRYKQILSELWKRYKDIKYHTEISKWEKQGDLITAETVTMVRGTKSEANDNFKLEAKLISTQTYKSVNGKLQVFSQKVLSEQSSLSTGEAPPLVQLKAPEIIGVGRQYVLDAIVTEPLGTSLLLGAAIDESVDAKNYLNDNTIDLRPLRAGGLFKIGQAPFTSGDRWISVVLVRESGITIASQRLRVSRDFTGNQYTPLPEPDTTPTRVPSRPNSNQTL
jgi:ketosteroid isomerase-like protein